MARNTTYRATDDGMVEILYTERISPRVLRRRAEAMRDMYPNSEGIGDACRDMLAAAGEAEEAERRAASRRSL